MLVKWETEFVEWLSLVRSWLLEHLAEFQSLVTRNSLDLNPEDERGAQTLLGLDLDVTTWLLADDLVNVETETGTFWVQFLAAYGVNFIERRE